MEIDNDTWPSRCAEERLQVCDCPRRTRLRRCFVRAATFSYERPTMCLCRPRGDHFDGHLQSRGWVLRGAPRMAALQGAVGRAEPAAVGECEGADVLGRGDGVVSVSGPLHFFRPSQERSGFGDALPLQSRAEDSWPDSYTETESYGWRDSSGRDR